MIIDGINLKYEDAKVNIAFTQIEIIELHNHWMNIESLPHQHQESQPSPARS